MEFPTGSGIKRVLEYSRQACPRDQDQTKTNLIFRPHDRPRPKFCPPDRSRDRIALKHVLSRDFIMSKTPAHKSRTSSPVTSYSPQLVENTIMLSGRAGRRRAHFPLSSIIGGRWRSALNLVSDRTSCRGDRTGESRAYPSPGHHARWRVPSTGICPLLHPTPDTCPLITLRSEFRVRSGLGGQMSGDQERGQMSNIRRARASSSLHPGRQPADITYYHRRI